MKVLAKIDEHTVMVQMTVNEFRLLSEEVDWRDFDKVKVGEVKGVKRLADHLSQLQRSKPEIVQLRGLMQAFLSLTEPETIQKTLDEAGVVLPSKDATQEKTASEKDEDEDEYIADTSDWDESKGGDNAKTNIS